MDAHHFVVYSLSLLGSSGTSFVKVYPHIKIRPTSFRKKLHFRQFTTLIKAPSISKHSTQVTFSNSGITYSLLYCIPHYADSTHKANQAHNAQSHITQPHVAHAPYQAKPQTQLHYDSPGTPHPPAQSRR